MRAAGLALLLAAAPALAAPKTAEVRRGRIEKRVPVNGTVRVEDVFRLKSTIEGRIEAVLASSYTWGGADAPLGLLSNTELSALIDSRQTTPTEVLEERWQRIYQPTQVKCPADCFVLAVFAKPKRKVLPQAVLFEVAATVRLVGRVRPADRHWIREGQPVDFWPLTDPKYKQRVKVDRFSIDVPGERTDTGGTFTALLDRKHYLNPGTPWAGEVIVEVKPAALQVPTASLIQYKDGVYLPVRVSTGMTTETMTEVIGIDEKRPVLILDGGSLAGTKPHSVEPGPPPPPPTEFFDDGKRGNTAVDDSKTDKPADDEDED